MGAQLAILRNSIPKNLAERDLYENIMASAPRRLNGHCSAASRDDVFFLVFNELFPTLFSQGVAFRMDVERTLL